MVTREDKRNLQYIKFYKPYGVLCDFADDEGRRTLKEFFPFSELQVAGRLGLDSEGLVFLTNDGWVNHRITSPNFHLPKTYLVLVEGKALVPALQQLRRGTIIKHGYKTLACEAEVILQPDLPEREKPITVKRVTTWLKIILREGKKRQVRQMTAAVGLPTLRLVRVRIGPISIEELKPGEWRLLDEQEVGILMDELKAQE